MVSDPEALTVCGPDIPEPATGDGVMVTVEAPVVDHWRVVLLPSSISEGFAANVAVGDGVVLTVTWRVKVSTPEQPVRLTVRVKVVGELTTKVRVPPEGGTGTDEPVVLSVIVAVSAFVLAQDRFTDVPGMTQ
jgi:hypothetical protein